MCKWGRACALLGTEQAHEWRGGKKEGACVCVRACVQTSRGARERRADGLHYQCRASLGGTKEGACVFVQVSGGGLTSIGLAGSI